MQIPVTAMAMLSLIIRDYMLKKANETRDPMFKEELERAYRSFQTKHMHSLNELPDADKGETESENYGAYGMRFGNLVILIVLSLNFDGSVNVLQCDIRQI